MKTYQSVSFAAAILMAGAGAAYAGSGGRVAVDHPTVALAQGTVQTPSAGGAVQNPPAALDSLSTVDLAPIGQWAVGRTLYDREGDAVGVVKGVHRNGNALIVSVGQYGGIGPRDIVVDKKYLNQSGSGADMELITNLDAAQLKAQPTVDTYEKMR